MISIFTQVYNTKPFLIQCIESVLNQTLLDFEYVLIDNGSTDGCKEILEYYAALDKRIRLIRFEKNQFAVWLSIAQQTIGSQYIAYLDSDDWWEPDYLESLIGFLEKNSLDLAVTGTINFFEEAQISQIMRKLDNPVIVTQQEFAQHCSQLWAFPNTNLASVMRTELFLKADFSSIFSEKPINGEDTVSMLKYMELCSRIGIDSTALYHYRVRPKQVPLQYSSHRFDSNVYVYHEIRRFLELNHTFDIPNQEWLKFMYLNLTTTTLGLLDEANLSPNEKMVECARIATHPITAAALTNLCPQREQWLNLMWSLTAKAAKDKEVMDTASLQAVLSTLCPRCGRAVTEETIPLLLQESVLVAALQQDNPDQLARGLLDLIAGKRYTKQYDLCALLSRVISDHSPLSCIRNTRFFQKYVNICQKVLRREYIPALDEMTGLLFEEKIYAAKEFLQLYITLAALENQVSAFIFGKIKLAQLYRQENCREECAALLAELEEMGVEENAEICELRTFVSPQEEKHIPESCHRLSVQPPLQERSELLAQYLELAAHGKYCIGSWLKQNGYRRIVYCCKPVQLYGMGFQFGTLDKLVVSELLQSDGVEVVGLITRTVTTLANLPTLSIQEVNSDQSIDAVLAGEPEIYAEALKLFGNRVVFLRKVIADIYFCSVTMRPMLEVLRKLQHEGHKVLYFSAPCAEDVYQPSQWERFIAEKGIIAGDFQQWGSPEAFSLSGMAEKYASLADFYKKLSSNATSAQGLAVRKNYYVEKLTINGAVAQSRYVVDNPQEYAYTIHMFGNSAVAGIGLEERDSSPSRLQIILNHEGIAARVLNLGVDGQNATNLAHRIADANIEADDVVVVVMVHRADTNEVLKPFFAQNGITFCAGLDSFHRPHDLGEVFFNAHHLNWNGNQKVAELIYQELYLNKKDTLADHGEIVENYASLDRPPIILEEYYNPIAQSDMFRRYINGLAARRKPGLTEIGAIVMNCNPFTLGHQYLIEACAKEVEWLYIFVVEEDQSAFRFEDRMKMVQQGAEHIPNVEVLPSGQFIISALTFPEYFRKNDLKELTIDPSADVELFGKYIAPTLGITIRFAGDEPLDSVTAQYNDTMRRKLPEYGLKFKVVHRLKVGGEIISASRVRSCIDNGDWESIRSMVPETTYKYINAGLF